MSYKSSLSNSGSCRQNSVHEKLHSTPSEEKIKFAGDESKDRLYEPKQNKKMVRVLTVIIYIFSVSLAAIMLSLYYVFFWNPKELSLAGKTAESDNVTNRITTAIPRCSKSHDDTKINSLSFQREDTFMDINATDDTPNLAFAPDSNDTETLPLTTIHPKIPYLNNNSSLLTKINNNSSKNENPPNNT